MAWRLLSFLASSPISFRGTGGGGNGPAGAGRIGMLNVVAVAVALDDPFGADLSGALRVVSLGMEFVVDTRGGRPG